MRQGCALARMAWEWWRANGGILGNCRHVSLLMVISGLFGATSCAASVDEQACMAEYVGEGADDRVVHTGRLLCHLMADPNTSTADREEAMCALRAMPSARTMAAFKAVVLQCRDSRRSSANH